MLSIFAPSAQSQTLWKNSAGSQILVKGTSNLHDWTMQASILSCQGSFSLKGDQLQELSTLSFTLPVTNLKSNESLMDSRAYKALKAEDFPRITFKLSSATVVEAQKIIKAAGILTIGGVSNTVTLQTSYTVSGQEITCKGSKVILMSDYKIKAPSFMMGALKTGNSVTIDMVLKFKN